VSMGLWDRKCEICGGHQGRGGPDHTACSKLKQTQKAASPHRHKARKTLSIKSQDFLISVINAKEKEKA